TNVPANATPGATIEIDWTVANIGSMTATGSWKDVVYLSSNNFGGYRLGEVAHTGPPAANPSYTRPLSAPLPLGARRPAFLVIVGDGNRQIFEPGGENNNQVSAPILLEQVPYPDLAVSDVTVPAQLTIGNPATVTIGWTVVNLGTGAGAVSSWVDKIFAARVF